MLARCVLITNNPAFFSHQQHGLVVRPVHDTGHAVMCATRDAIHAGWTLLNHPLYGNYRPHQQPFRSMVLSAPAGCVSPTVPEVNAESLHFVEQALDVYAVSAHNWATPDNVPLHMHKDCSAIDVALMQETLSTID